MKKDNQLSYGFSGDSDLTHSHHYQGYHAWMVGQSGYGKTLLLAALIRQMMLRDGTGLCVLDPHGDLIDDLMAYAAHKRLHERVLCLSPQFYPGYLLGFNPLDYTGNDIGYKAAQLVKMWVTSLNQDSSSTTPRLARWLYNVFYVLIYTKRPLTDALILTELKHQNQRLAIIEKLERDPHFDRPEILSDFKSLENTKREDYISEQVESSCNRFRQFFSTRFLKDTFTAKETINFQDIMNSGKILLVDLSSRNDHIPTEAAHLLGSMLISEIINAGKQRPTHSRNPFFVYVDEFAAFLTPEMGAALDQIRKYRVGFTLINQHVSQLQEFSQTLYKSVLTNCHTKIIFGGLPDEDREILAKELYAPHFNLKEVKDQVFSTKQINPRQVKMTVTSKGNSSAFALSLQYAMSKGISEGFSLGVGKSLAKGLSRSITKGTSQAVMRSLSNSLSTGLNEAVARAWNQSASKTLSRSQTEGVQRSLSKSLQRSFGQTISESETEGISETIANGVSETMTKGLSEALARGYSTTDSTSSSDADTESHSEAETHSEGNSTSSGQNQSTKDGPTGDDHLNAQMAMITQGISETVSGIVNTAISKATSSGTSHTDSESTSETESNTFTSTESKSFSEGVNKTMSKGVNESITRGISEAFGMAIQSAVADALSLASTEGESDGWTEGLSESLSTGIIETLAKSVTDAVTETFSENVSEGLSLTDTESITQALSSSISRSLTFTKGQTLTTGKSWGESEQIVTLTDQVQELTHRTFWTIPEQLHQVKALLHNLPEGDAVVHFKDAHSLPIQVTTPFYVRKKLENEFSHLSFASISHYFDIVPKAGPYGSFIKISKLNGFLECVAETHPCVIKASVVADHVTPLSDIVKQNVDIESEIIIVDAEKPDSDGDSRWLNG